MVVVAVEMGIRVPVEVSVADAVTVVAKFGVVVRPCRDVQRHVPVTPVASGGGIGWLGSRQCGIAVERTHKAVGMPAADCPYGCWRVQRAWTLAAGAGAAVAVTVEDLHGKEMIVRVVVVVVLVAVVVVTAVRKAVVASVADEVTVVVKIEVVVIHRCGVPFHSSDSCCSAADSPQIRLNGASSAD